MPIHQTHQKRKIKGGNMSFSKNPRIQLPSDTKVPCAECGKEYPITYYYETNGYFFPTGRLTICPQCIAKIVPQSTDSISQMDKFCQWADWAFYPYQWRLLCGKANSVDQYYRNYIKNNNSVEFDGEIHWDSINEKWKELEKAGKLSELSPEVVKSEEMELRKFWETDENQYTYKELKYLDDLYHDIQKTQGVGAGIQTDQAKKMARLSLDMDKAEKSNQLELYAKLMIAYTNLIKIAEFTPKSSTSSSSFESMGELIAFLEKTGFINRFYDGEERDIVDKTIKNQQMFLRRIVSGDSSLSERVEQRLTRMNLLDKLEDGISADEEWTYDLAKDEDWMDNDTFDTYIDDGDEKEELSVDDEGE